MSESKSNSGSTSVATSPTAPPNAEKNLPVAHTPSGMSEADYLAKQAEDARQAMQKVWSDVKHSLAGGADVRAWTRKYPLIAAGTAVAAGVAAGYVLTPRDRREVEAMWESIKDKFHSAAPTHSADRAKHEAQANAPGQPSFLTTVLHEAVKMATPLISALVAQHASGNGEQRHDENDGHDGTEHKPTV